MSVTQLHSARVWVVGLCALVVGIWSMILLAVVAHPLEAIGGFAVPGTGLIGLGLCVYASRALQPGRSRRYVMMTGAVLMLVGPIAAIGFIAFVLP